MSHEIVEGLDALNLVRNVHQPDFLRDSIHPGQFDRLSKRYITEVNDFKQSQPTDDDEVPNWLKGDGTEIPEDGAWSTVECGVPIFCTNDLTGRGVGIDDVTLRDGIIWDVEDSISAVHGLAIEDGASNYVVDAMDNVDAIYDYIDLQSIIILSMTCKAAYTSKGLWARKLYFAALGGFPGATSNDVKMLLKDTGASITGSYALKVLAGAGVWEYGDKDVTVPLEHLETFLRRVSEIWDTAKLLTRKYRTDLDGSHSLKDVLQVIDEQTTVETKNRSFRSAYGRDKADRIWKFLTLILAISGVDVNDFSILRNGDAPFWQDNLRRSIGLVWAMTFCNQYRTPNGPPLFVKLEIDDAWTMDILVVPPMMTMQGSLCAFDLTFCSNYIDAGGMYILFPSMTLRGLGIGFLDEQWQLRYGEGDEDRPVLRREARRAKYRERGFSASEGHCTSLYPGRYTPDTGPGGLVHRNRTSLKYTYNAAVWDSLRSRSSMGHTRDVEGNLHWFGPDMFPSCQAGMLAAVRPTPLACTIDNQEGKESLKAAEFTFGRITQRPAYVGKLIGRAGCLPWMIMEMSPSSIIMPNLE